MTDATDRGSAAARRPSRRLVLGAGAATGLGLTALALPAASAAASPGGAGVEPDYATYTDPVLDGPLFALAVDQSGRIVMGGAFSTLGPRSRTNVARVFPDGSLDGTFADPAVTGTGALVFALAIDGSGRIIIGGKFTSVGGVSRTNIARLLPNGSVDPNFVSNTDGTVRAIAVDGNDRVTIGGEFTTAAGTARSRVARLLPNGALDTSFVDPAVGSGVYALSRGSDGTLVIGGAFTSVGGTTRNRLARLGADGALDAGYDPNANGTVYALTRDATGRIIAGGNFSGVGAATRKKVARLATDGTVDPTFQDPDVQLSNRDVFSLAVDPQGAILIGGDFTSVGGSNRSGGARLLATGALDTSFADPLANDYVNAIALDAAGRIYYGGWFDRIGGTTQEYFARLDPDGTLASIRDDQPGRVAPTRCRWTGARAVTAFCEFAVTAFCEFAAPAETTPAG